MSRGGRAEPSAEVVRRAVAVAVWAGAVVHLVGDPGQGKTSLVEQATAAMGLRCLTVVASLHEPVDFNGLPVRGERGVELLPVGWAVRAAEGGGCVVFLDEISNASPAVQAALLRVVLERVVGDLVLPSTMAFVTASNPPETAADGYELSAPLANRLCHVPWRADPAAWATGMLNGWAAPGPLQRPDPGRAEAAVRVATATVVGFIRTRPELLSVLPAASGDRSGPWPSPRSWSMAARLAGFCAAAGFDHEVSDVLIRGSVGEAAAHEYLVYAEQVDLPDPEAVLADPGLVAAAAGRLDRLHVVLSGVVAVVEARLDHGRWLAAWDVLAAAALAGHPDVASPAARRLVLLRRKGWSVPAAARVFRPVLAAAGRARP